MQNSEALPLPVVQLRSTESIEDKTSPAYKRAMQIRNKLNRKKEKGAPRVEIVSVIENNFQYHKLQYKAGSQPRDPQLSLFR